MTYRLDGGYGHPLGGLTVAHSLQPPISIHNFRYYKFPRIPALLTLTIRIIISNVLVIS
jgi:hypothetical protein